MKKETNSYKGWMNSDFFWKRVVGVYGHAALGGLTAGVTMMIVAMILA